jgi:hypothetical protein
VIAKPKTIAVEVRGGKMKKVGMLLALIGILIGIIIFLVAIFGRTFAEAVLGPGPSSGPPPPAFTEFLLDVVDTIRLHAGPTGFIGVVSFVAGLMIIRHTRLR